MTIYRAANENLRISTKAWKNPKLVTLEKHRTIVETVQAHTGGTDVRMTRGSGNMGDPYVFVNDKGTKFFVEKL